MEWNDQGILLSSRRHGETSAIVNLLSPSHGLHAGLVRGGAGKRARGILQPGNLVRARWRARLAEHLGTFTCELVRAHAAAVFDDPPRLAGLSSACAVAMSTLPEREPQPAVFEALLALLDNLAEPSWPTLYVKWEVGLLKELGFGLDLTRCAATGSEENLAYVSPRTGRAVSLEAGRPYREQLLPLPAFLLAGGGAGEAADIADGLGLTGHFLERHVLGQRGHPLPAARRRLAERLRAAPGQG